MIQAVHAHKSINEGPIEHTIKPYGTLRDMLTSYAIGKRNVWMAMQQCLMFLTYTANGFSNPKEYRKRYMYRPQPADNQD